MVIPSQTTVEITFSDTFAEYHEAILLTLTKSPQVDQLAKGGVACLHQPMIRDQP